MNFLPEEIEQYAEDHTRKGPAYLDALSRETWLKVVMPRMLSGHLQGRFLSMISKMIRPSFILEIGTYTGYSALCLAEGLTPDGKLLTIDINDELKGIQDKYFSTSGFQGKIDRRFGAAADIIPSITDSIDLAFVDADKENYGLYYDMLLERMKPGSWILFDNMLWSGKVLGDAPASDIETVSLKALNDRIVKDDRVDSVLLPLRDGVMMVGVRE